MKYRKKSIPVDAYQITENVIIHTLEGDMKAEPGDWIITGVNGEQWPVKKDIFEKTYEEYPDTKYTYVISYMANGYLENSKKIVLYKMLQIKCDSKCLTKNDFDKIMDTIKENLKPNYFNVCILNVIRLTN